MSISSSPSGKRLEALIAFSGIVLVALNLRATVVSLPPIYQQIALSFPVSVASRSFMSTLPLVCFALFGLLARRASHLFGLEKSLLIAMVMVAAGELTRAWLSSPCLCSASFQSSAWPAWAWVTCCFRLRLRTTFVIALGPSAVSFSASW